MTNLASDQKVVGWPELTSDLKDLIVARYKGTNMPRYKGSWKGKVKSLASSTGYEISRLNENAWIDIEKSFEEYRPSSNTTKSNYGLSKEEKRRVLGGYDAIAESDKWRLTTGTVVEDKMKALVEICSFEHPAHSIIMDPDDLVWKKYFTDEELNEIKSFNAKLLKKIPEELQTYLDTYKKGWNTGADLCEFAENQKHIPFNKFDKRWVRESMTSLSEPFAHEQQLRLSDYSESDLLHEHWAFIYKMFRDCGIQAKLGERTSTSVSLARNSNRSLEADKRSSRG